MRKVIVISVIALIHFVFSVGVAMTTFEIKGFMFGIYPQPSNDLLHRVLMILRTVLLFPFGLVAESLGPGVRFLGWPLVVLNSLLWAAIIYLLIALSVQSRKQKPV